MTPRKVIDLTLTDILPFAGEEKEEDYLPDALLREIGVDSHRHSDTWNKLHKGRLTRRNLIDFSFESDEEATAVLFLLDHRPFAVMEKYGGRSSHEVSVVDKEVFREFATILLNIDLEERLEGLPDVVKGVVPIAKENGYVLHTVGDEGMAVHIQFPCWQHGYESMFGDHDAYLDGQKVLFVRWKNHGKQYYEGGNDIVVRFPDKTEKVTHGIEVAFILRKPAVAPKMKP